MHLSLVYYNSLFTCLSKKDLTRLQLVQSSAARILTRIDRRAHVTPVLKSLHWLPVFYRINYKVWVLTFTASHGQAPPYICDLIRPYASARSLGSSNQHLLMTSPFMFSPHKRYCKA